MTLEERLAAKLAKHEGKTEQPVDNQCSASSKPSKTSRYGPDGFFRCKKDANHKGWHEDDYGSRWYDYPERKMLLWLGP